MNVGSNPSISSLLGQQVYKSHYVLETIIKRKISMNKSELLEKLLKKILIVFNILSEKYYKVKFVNQRNGMYRIDIARHEDDFWLSDEYKVCERILGDNLIEGTYGSDTYTLWIKADEGNKEG